MLHCINETQPDWNIAFYSRAVALRLCRHPLYVNTFPFFSFPQLVVIWCDMLGDIQSWSDTLPCSRPVLPCQGFGGRTATWKNLPTQLVQMRCKSLAAALFVLQEGYSSIDTYPFSFLRTPSSSSSSLSPFSSSFSSTVFSSFPFFPFSFNSHVSPLLQFLSSPLSSPVLFLLLPFLFFFSSRYFIILHCWCENAEKRPPFSELVRDITTSLEAILEIITWIHNTCVWTLTMLSDQLHWCLIKCTCFHSVLLYQRVGRLSM